MSKRNPKYISVCIPAYKELSLTKTLDSLIHCDSLGLEVDIFILINGSSKDDRVTFDSNMQCLGLLESWLDEYDGDLNIHYHMDLNLPLKHAGVGLARKMLGDEAAARYKEEEINGIIAYLDADCTVAPNYLQAISSFFSNSKKEAAAIHFEHPVSESNNPNAIMEYEAHLRYYIQMQKWVGFPFAYHTVGSSMAVLSKTYTSKGGMNKRKAGEDFYFLQKFIKDNLCGKITNTTVFPSARTSDRVPFGTGRAMLSYTDTKKEGKSYNPQSFILIKKWLSHIDHFYDEGAHLETAEEPLSSFLEEVDIENKIAEIKNNIGSPEAFQKRFFQFFDAFQLMKCLHYMRDHGLDDLAILDCMEWFAQEKKMNTEPLTLERGLDLLRKEDLIEY